MKSFKLEQLFGKPVKRHEYKTEEGKFGFVTQSGRVIHLRKGQDGHLMEDQWYYLVQGEIADFDDMHLEIDACIAFEL